MSSQPSNNPSQQREQLELLRKRMVQDLEQFLNQCIDRPLPRFVLKRVPAKRYNHLLN
jgi:hypothetical protein